MRDMLHLAVFKNTHISSVGTQSIRKTDSSEDIQKGFDPQPDKFNYWYKASFEFLKESNWKILLFLCCLYRAFKQASKTKAKIKWTFSLTVMPGE